MITRSYIAAEYSNPNHINFSHSRVVAFVASFVGNILKLNRCFAAAAAALEWLIQHSIFCAWSHVFASELDVFAFEHTTREFKSCDDVFLFVYVSFCLSVQEFECVCVYLSVCLFYPQLISSVRLCVCMRSSVYISVFMRMYLSVGCFKTKRRSAYTIYERYFFFYLTTCLQALQNGCT